MRTTLTLLLASTALTAAIALPAWSAIPRLDASDAGLVAAVTDARPDAPAVVLARNDDDDHGDDDHGDNDDEGDDDEGDDDQGDDDDEGGRSGRDDDDHESDGDDDRGGRRAPVVRGPVAPPANGLFGNGAPPQVQVK